MLFVISIALIKSSHIPKNLTSSLYSKANSFSAWIGRIQANMIDTPLINDEIKYNIALPFSLVFGQSRAKPKILCAKDRPALTGYIIGNKKDIGQSSESITEKGSDLARYLNLGYIETSAKTGENVEYAFFTIAKSLYDALQNDA